MEPVNVDEHVKEETPNIYEDNVIILTPQQKMREWTRVYHEIRCSKWVKNHFGIPFWALHIKYLQSRYLQRMWATRMLRREGLGEIWNVKSLVYPTQIKINDNDNDNENENELHFDEDDLHYLFYERPPIGYITNKDKKTDNQHENDEKTIVDSVQFWFDTYSTRLYWDAFDHDNGNIIFSQVKWKEHKMRLDAKINGIRDAETNTLKPKDENRKINPYTIIPEENPKSEFIQFGGRYLSDYVDFKPKKTNKMISTSELEHNNKLLSDSESKSQSSEIETKKNDYRDTKGYKFNRSFAWFTGKVSKQSLEENIKDIEALEFGDRDNYDEIQRVIGERQDIDLRSDMHKNKRFSGFHQLKQLMPSFKEISIILSLKKLSLIKSINMIMDDYKKIFNKNNRMNDSPPPQISLSEFNVLDQFETSIGNFGVQHTLFSDWFIAVDNKREECDKSYGTAIILNDRLIFSGFLIHSCIEMGHRTRNRFRDFVGFVNLVSHEFEPEWDLLPYYSIGIKLRSDGRTYLLGLECLNRNKLMIFNGIISVAATPDGEWDYYEIPLHHFRPYDRGEFIQGENWMKVRYLRSIGIQAIGATGSFNLEIAWIRAMAYEARFDIADEHITFIQDIDALGIYKEDLIKFHIIQHQYFIDDFADPFRFEDNGVFDDNVYLGPPRAQRQHFSKLSPDLLRYIDIIDDIPLTEDTQKYLYYYLDADDMYMFENYLSNKLIGSTKHIQQLFKHDTISICDATNNLLYNQLKNQSKHNQYLTSNVYHNQNIHMVNTKEQNVQHKIPFVFNDVKQTSNNPITILTQRRRELLRFSIPEHLRERVVGKWPHLI